MSQSDVKSAAASSTPSSPTTPTSPDVINRAATKLCHIVKRPDFDGYGFNLHSEKAKPGQFIGKVDANSPAEAAGLKEGDRIIEVNGTAINSETHKQVVQRIKAIACEVRLLLIDVDGKGDGGPAANGHNSNNNMVVSKTEQVLPGASDNINSITMVSTKRHSQETQRSSGHALPAVPVAANGNDNGKDVTDKAMPSNKQDQLLMTSMMNNNNIPPPPSTTMASMQKMSPTNNNANGMENGNGSTMAPASNTNKAGSLNLPMTAAEMRAKLLSKKKYDPKNESVDLKKKYEIVQKL